MYFLCFYVRICVTVTELGTLEDRLKLGASGRRPRRGFLFLKNSKKKSGFFKKPDFVFSRVLTTNVCSGVFCLCVQVCISCEDPL